MFEVKRITRPLDVGEYDDEYDGITIDVWVNPSRQHVLALGEIMKATRAAMIKEDKEGEPPADVEEVTKVLLEWYAESWGQKPEEVIAFYQEAPIDLWQWLTRCTHELVVEYRKGKLGPNSKDGSGPGQSDIPIKPRQPSVTSDTEATLQEQSIG